MANSAGSMTTVATSSFAGVINHSQRGKSNSVHVPPFFRSQVGPLRANLRTLKQTRRHAVQGVKAENITEKTIENDNKYLLQNYGPRTPVVFTHGKGSTLYDTEGKEYLDFAAGIAVNVLGHSDPAWTEVVAKQAGELCHVSNLYHTLPGPELAKRLCESSFADRVFFCNSGTEANEAAIKFARRYQSHRVESGLAKTAGTELVSFSRCFHGRTMGALSITANPKYREPFAPMLQGCHFAEYGDVGSAARFIQPGKTAAVFVEPVQGEGGVFPAQKEFLKRLRELCDFAGCALVFDEVQCGLGRTGKLFAHQHYGVQPDIMTLAKPLAAGLPVGAVLMRQQVADAIRPGDHGSTFAGNPLVMAAGLAVMDRIEEDGFVEAVVSKGDRLMEGLKKALVGKSPKVKEVRGMGLMVGIELDCPAGPALGVCRDNGLLVLTAGAGNVMRLVPPLIVTDAEIDTAVSIIAKAILES